MLSVWCAHLVNGRTASGRCGCEQNPDSLSTVVSLCPAVTTTGEESWNALKIWLAPFRVPTVVCRQATPGLPVTRA